MSLVVVAWKPFEAKHRTPAVNSRRAASPYPVFHAMAWGLPYAAMMVGASLVMPDRFSQPGPEEFFAGRTRTPARTSCGSASHGRT